MAIFIGFFFLVVLERKGCLLVFDISKGTETYFDYFGLTSLFNLALEAKRDRKRTFLGYYSYPFTSFGKLFLSLIHAFRGVASRKIRTQKRYIMSK